MTAGLTAREATWLVRQLFDGLLDIVAADLVEVAPVLDPTGRTVALAAHLLALMADGLSRSTNERAGTSVRAAAATPARATGKGAGS